MRDLSCNFSFFFVCALGFLWCVLLSSVFIFSICAAAVRLSWEIFRIKCNLNFCDACDFIASDFHNRILRTCAVRRCYLTQIASSAIKSTAETIGELRQRRNKNNKKAFTINKQQNNAISFNLVSPKTRETVLCLCVYVRTRGFFFIIHQNFICLFW